MSRYQKLPSGETGIFKDTQSGNYYAIKYVEGKKVSKTFKTPKEARNWRESKKSYTELIDYDCEPNGSKPFTFYEAWEKYRKIEFPKLEESTIEVKEERCKFFDELLDVKMIFITPDFVDDYILKKKEAIIKTMKKNRYSLKNEIVELSAVFSFYRKNMDYKFVNPVIKDRHFPLGVIKEKPDTNKKMEPFEINRFFAAMHKINECDRVFADLAESQFYFAGRISEAAAIRPTSLNLRERTLIIDRAISWRTKTKTFRSLKGTKTGKTRYAHISDKMMGIFKNRISKMVPGCEFLFHVDGRPLHYYEIHHAYTRGLKLAGLFPKYSATHIMRHSMAKQARIVTGSIDGAQAMGGWASVKQCEEYADSPSHLQIEAVGKVEERLRLVN